MPSANNKPRDPKQIRVLMIDDNPGDVDLIRDALSQSLSDISFHLSEASDLRGGLALARQETADVILLDLGLPDTHYMETLQEAFRAVPWIPIIVLSGHAETQTILAAVREGARDYLVKDKIDALFLQQAIIRQVEWRRRIQKYRDLAIRIDR
ncbi:MAG: response regulator [Acidobacteria bacterium]|nr:response regulator [Acidobacteriota bacterium]